MTQAIQRNDKGQFVPGQSGNPDGKPAGVLSLVRILREELEKEMTFTVGTGKNKKKVKEQTARVVIRRIIDKAVKDGNEKMLTLVMNYVDGKPTQPISGPGGGPIGHAIIDDQTAKAFKKFEERFVRIDKQSQAKKMATSVQPDGNQEAPKKKVVVKKVIKAKKAK